SEFLKLSLAVWLGALLATKRPLLDKAGHVLFPRVPGVVAGLGLAMRARNRGTMMVMAMLVAGSRWVAGSPRRCIISSGWRGLVGGGPGGGASEKGRPDRGRGRLRLRPHRSGAGPGRHPWRARPVRRPRPGDVPDDHPRRRPLHADLRRRDQRLAAGPGLLA